MIDAPPPMSEPSPTTTPAEIRPSTMDVPSVPALKFTKPSCMTVVPWPGARRGGPGRRRRCARRWAARSRPSAGTCPRRAPGPGRGGAAQAGGLELRHRARAEVVQTTLDSTPKMPSRLQPCGGTRRWRAGAGAGRRRARRRAARQGAIGAHGDDLDTASAPAQRPAAAGPSAATACSAAAGWCRRRRAVSAAGRGTKCPGPCRRRRR